jgi:hypothetical protein
VNFHTGTNFDATAEALNEVSKTLWALAYFLPLLRSARVATVVRSPTDASSTPEETSNKLRTTRRVSKGAAGWILPAPRR